jgi:ribosomal protein S6
MSEQNIPATEEASQVHEEHVPYECSFHILPTVADGEVAGVVAAIKRLITEAGGACFDEEVPQRTTLAYEITRHEEGRSQRFTSTWFGWVRFTFSPLTAAHLDTELSHMQNILRYLLIRLTKEEIAHPQRFFEKKAESATVVLSESDSEESVEVSEEDLNKSIEGITS